MPTEQLRPILIVALCFVVLLMWQAWQADYGPKPTVPSEEHVTGAPTAETVEDSGPDVPVLDQGSASEPSAPGASDGPTVDSQQRAPAQERGVVRVVTVSTRADGFCLSVRDTGIGITPAFLPHLFDEFRQEKTGRSRKQHGSGLGLAITRRLVDKMGGTISVQSETDRGTTFTVTAPFHIPGGRMAAADDTARPPARSSSPKPPRAPDRSR